MRQKIGHSRPRIAGLDIARALALFGIMGNHLMGSNTEASWLITRVMSDFHAVAFAVLIGAGAQLEYDAAVKRGKTSWLPVVIRAVVLIILGLVVGWWATKVAVILVTLGLLSLVCRAAVTTRTALLLAGLGASVVFGPLLIASNFTNSWGRPLYSPDFFDVIRPEAYLSLLLADPYPFISWVSYGLVGIVYVRTVVHRNRPYLLVAGVAMLGAIAVLAADYATRPRSALFLDRLLTKEGYSGSYVNVVSSSLIVIVLIALCSWAASKASGMASKAMGVLAGVGQLTLSWYVIHIFASDRSIGYLENLPDHLAYLDIWVWIGQIVVICLISPLYLSRFRIGPLEALPRVIGQRMMDTRRDSPSESSARGTAHVSHPGDSVQQKR